MNTAEDFIILQGHVHQHNKKKFDNRTLQTREINKFPLFSEHTSYISSPFSRSMRSFTTRRYSRGESTPPCGQPCSAATFSVPCPRFTVSRRLVSMLLTRLMVASSSFCLFIAPRSASAEIQLNAHSMSRNSITAMQFLLRTFSSL